MFKLHCAVGLVQLYTRALTSNLMKENKEIGLEIMGWSEEWRCEGWRREEWGCEGWSFEGGQNKRKRTKTAQ